MQISHVAPRYFPAISGSEFYIQEISEKLQQRNHKIKVHCSDALDYRAFGSSKGKRVNQEHTKINKVDVAANALLVAGAIISDGQSRPMRRIK